MNVIANSKTSLTVFDLKNADVSAIVMLHGTAQDLLPQPCRGCGQTLVTQLLPAESGVT